MGMKIANGAEALFTTSQRRVLKLLFGNTDRQFYVNEIVRLAEQGVGATQRELEKLSAAGLLTGERRGNRKYYQANPDSPIYKELKQIVAKTSGTPELVEKHRGGRAHGHFKVPRKALQAVCERHHIRRLSVFGSAARSDFSADSDIDLLVEFEPNRSPSLGGMIALEDELSEVFAGRRVDLATPGILRNPYRRQAIERDLRPIYGA